MNHCANRADTVNSRYILLDILFRLFRRRSLRIEPSAMFSWLSKDASRRKEPEAYANVADGLKKLYKQKMLPLEEYFKFHDFHSPPLDDPDFDAKPMVLLVGQYSTGKTTFIRYLLEQVNLA